MASGDTVFEQTEMSIEWSREESGQSAGNPAGYSWAWVVRLFKSGTNARRLLDLVVEHNNPSNGSPFTFDTGDGSGVPKTYDVVIKEH